MGTHPIFESDFDCLTVQSVFNRPNGAYCSIHGADLTPTLKWLWSAP